MKKLILLLTLVLCSASFAKITHYSSTVKPFELIDFDENRVAEKHGVEGYSEYEFAIDLVGLTGVGSNTLRKYKFLRDAYVINGNIDNLNTPLDITDETVFNKLLAGVSVDPGERYTSEGVEPTGLFIQCEDVAYEEINRDQLFLIKSSNSNYMIVNISKYHITSVTDETQPWITNITLDSVTVDYWVQDDGSLDFTNFRDYKFGAPEDFTAEHFYRMPGNFFHLKWNKVETNKLKDYTVYLDDIAIFTTTDTTASYSYHEMDDMLENGGGERKFYGKSIGFGRFIDFHVTANYSDPQIMTGASKKLSREIMYATAISKSRSLKRTKLDIKLSGNSINFSAIKNVSNVSVYTVNGREILKSNTVKSGSLFVGSLPKGVYLLNIKTDSESISMKFSR